MIYHPPFIRDEYNRIEFTLRGSHGELAAIDFRFLESGIMYTEGMWVVETPKPTFNRIFLITKSSCDIDMEGTVFQLLPGDICLLPIHRSFVVTYHAGCEFLYFHFTISDGTGLDLMQFIDRVHRFRNDGNHLFNIIVRDYRADTTASVLKWQAALFSLVIQLVESPVIEQRLSGALSARHQNIVAYVQEHLSAGLTVNDLAARFGISRSALSKGFHRDMGISLKEYIEGLLLHRALRLLSETSLSVKEIAYELGYQDPFYFHRIFKKRMFETPIQYRNASIFERSFKTRNAADIAGQTPGRTTDRR